MISKNGSLVYKYIGLVIPFEMHSYKSFKSLCSFLNVILMNIQDIHVYTCNYLIQIERLFKNVHDSIIYNCFRKWHYFLTKLMYIIYIGCLCHWSNIITVINCANIKWTIILQGHVWFYTHLTKKIFSNHPSLFVIDVCM